MEDKDSPESKEHMQKQQEMVNAKSQNHPQKMLNQAVILNPNGANIRSRATSFATCPPFSSDTAPTTAYIVCARTSSKPELARFWGCTHISHSAGIQDKNEPEDGIPSEDSTAAPSAAHTSAPAPQASPYSAAAPSCSATDSAGHPAPGVQRAADQRHRRSWRRCLRGSAPTPATPGAGRCVFLPSHSH